MFMLHHLWFANFAVWCSYVLQAVLSLPFSDTALWVNVKRDRISLFKYILLAMQIGITVEISPSQLPEEELYIITFLSV